MKNQGVILWFKKRNKTCGDGMKYYPGDEMGKPGLAIKGIVLDWPGVTTRTINNY